MKTRWEIIALQKSQKMENQTFPDHLDLVNIGARVGHRHHGRTGTLNEIHDPRRRRRRRRRRRVIARDQQLVRVKRILLQYVESNVRLRICELDYTRGNKRRLIECGRGERNSLHCAPHNCITPEYCWRLEFPISRHPRMHHCYPR